MKTLLKPFNSLQKQIASTLFISLGIGLLGMITMSALGAENQSFHLIDYQTQKTIAWYFWQFVSTITICSFSALVGMYATKLTDKGIH